MEKLISYLAVADLTIWLLVTLVFFIALWKRDNSVIDIFYGLFFVVTAWTLPYWFVEYNMVQMILIFLVTTWGFRLSARIFFKNHGKPEDKRYANWREAWMKKGKTYFITRSYLQVFILQGIIVWLVLLPVTLVSALGEAYDPAILTIGIFIWITGFIFEVIADYQLDTFLEDKKNHGKIMTTGLFKYSRRPNYFGEALMWWGIAFIAASTLPPLYAVLAFISPITITYIVYAITGPITEALWEGNKEYQKYKKKTNYFVPGPPKKC